MKSLCFYPTSENILNTFCSDSIGRNLDVIRFCNILDSIEDCCTISLDGQWGSGKTFYVKQTKLLLDYLNPITELDETEMTQLDKYFDTNPNYKAKLVNSETYATVYYDAWENDDDVDPILSLIYAIIKSEWRDLNNAKTHNLLEIAGAIADVATGRNVNNFFSALKGNDIMAEIENEKSICALMRDFIEISIIEHGNRLVIFIDELDRCKPTYAVHMLERIKHFFNDDRVSFVFSTNSEQLQYTIQSYYGSGFNAGRYMDKFFDLRIALPEADFDRYIQGLNFQNTKYIYDRIGYLVIKHFHFQMREIARYIQLLKIAATKEAHNNRNYGFGEEKADLFCLVYIVPLLLGLKLCDMGAYNNFIEGRNSEIMTEFLSMPEVNLNGKTLLLSNNETFDQESKNDQKTIVTLKQRLTDVYNALFVINYSRDTHEHKVGEMFFVKNTHDRVIQIVSLLSDSAQYDI